MKREVYFIKYKKSVFRSLALISQLGITMISPILLCVFVAYQVDKLTKNHYGVLFGIILGVITGANMVYKLVKATLDRGLEDEKMERQNKNIEKVKVYKPKIASRIFKENDNE